MGDAEVERSGRYAKCGQPRGGCVHAVRLELCRRCGIQFAVCRSCDRGQRHCTRSCAAESRRLDLTEIRQRYRRSPAGRDAHREQERRRRGRLRAAGRLSPGATDADSVGDHTSQVDVAASSVDVRLVASMPGPSRPGCRRPSWSPFSATAARGPRPSSRTVVGSRGGALEIADHRRVEENQPDPSAGSTSSSSRRNERVETACRDLSFEMLDVLKRKSRPSGRPSTEEEATDPSGVR